MSLNKNLSTFAQYVSANGETVNINSDSLVITANAYFFANGSSVGSEVSIPPNLVTNGYIQDFFSPTVTLSEQGLLEYQFTGTTANSYSVPTTSNTFVQVFQNGVKLSANLFSVPNTSHINLVDAPDSNDVVQFVINNANSFTIQYSSTDINRLGLASNTYIQNEVLSNYITVSDASFKEYQFTSTTANSFAVVTKPDSTVQVWKSGIKLSNTLFSVPNTTHVNLVDTPQTNDTISIQAYNPNTYNLTITSNNLIYEVFTSNNYVQDNLFSKINTTVNFTLGGKTQSEFSNTTQSYFSFDSNSNTLVEVFVNGLRLANDQYSVYDSNNSVFLSSPPQSNDVISISGFNPNATVYSVAAGSVLGQAYVSNSYAISSLVSNNYASDTFVVNGGSTNVGIGTSTANTLLQLQGGIATGSVVTGTGNTTFDLSIHQTAIVTATAGNTDVTISNTSPIPNGAGFALIVADVASSTLTINASPTPKYPNATAPTLSGTAGEYLLVGFVHVGSGQLIATSSTVS
jgi:hypothetical protein